MTVTSKLYGERGRRRAAKLGIDPQRLPPGQSPTTKFPLLSVGPTIDVPTATWSLSVYGEVEAPFAVRWDSLLDLPQTEQVCDVHCVTRWSQFDMRWTGVRVALLLDRARPTAAASHALVHCFGGYTTNLPLAALRDDDVLIAHTYDGAPLHPDHGGPARLLVPSRYFWKSAKWVRAIEVLDHDEAGFWEANGYHNDGDPWREERTHADPLAFRSLRRRARGASEGP